MLIGYARIASWDRDLSVQNAALAEAGCFEVYQDLSRKRGGKDTWPGLTKAIARMTPEDALVVCRLTNLAASHRDFIKVLTQLSDKGGTLVSLNESIDASMDHEALKVLINCLVLFERELIAERTRLGIQAAKDEGRTGGRKPVLTKQKKVKAMQLLSQGKTHKYVAKQVGVSLPTLYRHFPASEGVESE